MTTAVIVQARHGSSRLPGKVLLPLGGGTVLSEVLRRCQTIPGIDTVCCAVSEEPGSDPVAAAAEILGVVVTRGSNDNVLDRYYRAAEHIGADTVVRVTSDCPLIDPGICGEVLTRLRSTGADYACNNLPPSFPHGLDCEAMTFAALEKAWRSAQREEEREHVTPWLRTEPAIRRSVLPGPGGDLVHIRWTIDYPEDYRFLQSVFDLLSPPPAIPPWRDVLALMIERPDIVRLNAARHCR